jgi:hypothetical protein
MGKRGTPGFQDCCHEENEKVRAEDITLFNSDDGFHCLLNSVNKEFNFYCVVQGFKKGYKLWGYPLLQHDIPEELSWNSVKGFYEIDEKKPSFQTVFSTFPDELL